MRARFGDRVAEIVAACTDTFESPKPDWPRRKQAYLERLADEPAYVLRVSIADKLHNARSMWRDWERDGPETFKRFNAGPSCQRWYFGALRDVFSAHLEESSLTAPFAALVEQIERDWP